MCRDDPSVIASGPTVGDATSSGPLDVLARFGGEPPIRLRRPRCIGSAAHRDPAFRKPKPDDPRLSERAPRSRSTARRDGRRGGRGRLAGSSFARTTGGRRRQDHCLVSHCAQCWRARPRRPAVVHRSSGETTVHSPRGQSGSPRNSRSPRPAWLAGDSARPRCRERGTTASTAPRRGRRRRRFDDDRPRVTRPACPRAASLHNNAYAFFDALGDLIHTGPTGTNVGDLQVILLA